MVWIIRALATHKPTYYRKLSYVTNYVCLFKAFWCFSYKHACIDFLKYSSCSIAFEMYIRFYALCSIER